MTDFSLYKGPEEEQPDKATVEDHKSVNITETETKSLETKQSNIFEDSLDDLFKPALAASKTVKPETLFDSGGSEDENLFSKDLKVVEKKMEETKPVQTTKTGLFADKSDSDSDSGLFSATQKSKIIPAAKSSLFDDSDSSEDDLFGVKTSRAVSSHRGNFLHKIV